MQCARARTLPCSSFSSSPSCWSSCSGASARCALGRMSRVAARVNDEVISQRQFERTYQAPRRGLSEHGTAGPAGRVSARPGARPADRRRAAQSGSRAPRPDGRRSRVARRHRAPHRTFNTTATSTRISTSACCSRTASNRPISRSCSAGAWWRAKYRSWCAAACTSATQRAEGPLSLRERAPEPALRQASRRRIS